MHQKRTFEVNNAVRSRVPLLIGLAGPSGGGKTFSGLRLAAGVQRVSGGDIHVIDTESGRALHYADRFKFKHVPFSPPFNPLSYLDAIEYCVSRGPGPILIDSTSHEHEGPGGVLEMHEAEVERIAKGDWQKAERVKMLCWQKPKGERRKLLQALVQMNRTIIFCFRAKEKLKMEKGKEPTKLGFMPIAGEEFVYELTASALLHPNAGGVPTWLGAEVGEKMIIKLPIQFKEHFDRKRSPLDEADGEFMARWAMGEIAETTATNQQTRKPSNAPSASDPAELIRWWDAVAGDKKASEWKLLTKEQAAILTAEGERRKSATPAATTSAGEQLPDLDTLLVQLEASELMPKFFELHNATYDDLENSRGAKRIEWALKVSDYLKQHGN